MNSARLPIDALREFLIREERLWSATRELFIRIQHYIAHHLKEEEFVGEINHAREALKGFSNLDHFEDAAALAGGFVNAHQLIGKTEQAGLLLQQTLEELIQKPSDETLQRLDEVLAEFEVAEATKLETLAKQTRRAA